MFCFKLFGQTVLIRTVQFILSTQFSSIWPIDRTLSGATTPSQSGHGSDGNEGVLCILQSSSITGTSPSDCLLSYTGSSLGEFYPSAEMQLVYSTALADWATYIWKVTVRLCSWTLKRFCTWMNLKVYTWREKTRLCIRKEATRLCIKKWPQEYA